MTDAQTALPGAAIADRYADALFDLALEANALDAVEADMRALAAMAGSAPDLRAFLRSPLYDADAKAGAILALADKAGFAPLTRNFLGLLARNRRLFALEAVAAAFAARLAAYRGEVTARATSAAPLSDEQTGRLRAELERYAGKAVNLAVDVDPALLGGLVVCIGSTMIDSSLRSKLNRLKSTLKEAS